MPEEQRQEASARFACNIRRLREARGLSQEEVACAAEISLARVSLIESGARVPRFEDLTRLAGALGVDPGKFFAGISYETRPHGCGDFVVEKEEEDGRG
jgi:transcriptional regulator with XRE-family HTH domain